MNAKAYTALRTTKQWYGLTPTELGDLTTSKRFAALPVHPAQVYAFVNAMLLSILLAIVCRYRKRHGVVFLLMVSIYPISRIILETVRIDNALDTGGLTISQGVSVGMLVAAALGWIWLFRQPLRSPKAIPFIPPPDPSVADGAPAPA
jgi:prolipoprotein diacylglyceryltransferase